MTHEVKLEVFEGPIDLLLQLISRQRVDIYDVSLSAITDEYLSVLAALPEVDLETATGFLVVAATLLELKSARLLPQRQNGEAVDPRLLEERDLLLARLVECSTFREAGAALQVRLEEGGRFHPRSVSLEERYAELQPDIVLKVGPADLVRAAARIFLPKPEVHLDTSHVTPLRVSVRDTIVEMTSVLREGRPATFEQLCGSAETRIDVVVRFLGLLELFKAGAIDISQHDRFGEIVAVWTGDAAAEEIIRDVDEYAADIEGAA